MKKNGGDCNALINLGFRIISLLRKGREALNFYHFTQNPGGENPISWDKEMYKIYSQLHYDAAKCIKGFKASALEDIKSAIQNEQTKVVSKLEEKFLVYQWSAIQINSVIEKDNTDYFPKGEASPILNLAQGNDKQLFAIYKPESKAYVEDIRWKIKNLVESWCSWYSEFIYVDVLYASQVIDELKNRFERNGGLNRYIRGMVVVNRDGVDGTSGNFDINISCQKPHYHGVNIFIALITFGLSEIGDFGHIKKYTTYQIVINLHSLFPSKNQNCNQDGGDLLELAPGDGSEAFCLCKYGYTGPSCEEKVIRQSSSILESEDFKKFAENLYVSEMFEKETVTEAISNYFTKVKKSRYTGVFSCRCFDWIQCPII